MSSFLTARDSSALREEYEELRSDINKAGARLTIMQIPSGMEARFELQLKTADDSLSPQLMAVLADHNVSVHRINNGTWAMAR